MFTATLVLRIAARSRLPTEWDSVQYVLGVDRFDVTQDSPNAPGYWSYVALARLVRLVTPLDAHRSLLALTAVGSAATGALLFVAGRQLGGRWLGAAAAALWATSPLAWFYGSMVNTKVFDAVALSAMLVLALRARAGGRQAVWAALVVGVASGFRPSSVIVLAPLAVFTLFTCCRHPRASDRSRVDSPRKPSAIYSKAVRFVLPLAVGAGAVAAWLVPASLEQPGGVGALRSVNDFMFSITARKTSILYGAPAAIARHNAGRAVVTALVALAPAVLVFALAVGARARAGCRWPPRLWLLAAAAVPGLLLTALLHIGTAGHVLAHLPATLLLLLAPAAYLRGRLRLAATVVVVLGSVLGAQRFLAGNGSIPTAVVSHRWVPTGLSLGEIRRVDAGIRRHRDLGERLDPSRDVLVYVIGNGDQWFRSSSLFLDDFAVHLIAPGADAISTYRRFEWFDEDAQVEVPPGGRAVVVLDRADPNLVEGDPAGGTTVPGLDDGTEARSVGPGAVVGGVRIVTDPEAFRPKRGRDHRRPCGGGPC